MKEKQLGDKIDVYLPTIDLSLESIHGMRTLILELLNLTRIESVPVKKNIQSNNLVNIVKSVSTHLCPWPADISFELDLLGDLSFLCDSYEMEIMLNNLVSNDVKYNVDHGKSFISLKKVKILCILVCKKH
jgi:signal transduction histidine kinase